MNNPIFFGRFFAGAALLLSAALFPACAADGNASEDAEIVDSEEEALNSEEEALKAGSIGKLGGKDFVPASSLAVLGKLGKANLLFIGLSTVPGACAHAKANAIVAGERRISFDIMKKDGGNIKAGKYPVSATIFEDPWTATTGKVFGPDCKDTLNFNPYLGKGLVTIESISAQKVKGRFDVTLPNGERLAGKFSAPLCDLPLSNGGTQEQCLPAQ